MNSLLDNAVASIQLGVEDYHASQEDSRRVLSAIRNITAGLLLLFKEELRRKSPENSKELFVKAKKKTVKDSDGKFIVEGCGKSTVTTQQIKENFELLDIEVDWKNIDKVLETRNDIEHYYTELDSNSLLPILATLLPILKDFIEKILKETPLDLLGDDTWDILLEVTELYNSMRKECTDKIDKINLENIEIEKDHLVHIDYLSKKEADHDKEMYDELYKDSHDDIADEKDCEANKENTLEELSYAEFCKYKVSYPSVSEILKELFLLFQCPECHLNLMKPLIITDDIFDMSFLCLSCNKESTYSTLIVPALAEYYPYDYHDGDESLVSQCPECTHYSYLNEIYFCFTCGYMQEHTRCFCGRHISVDEQELEGMCSYHYHQMGKDDY